MVDIMSKHRQDDETTSLLPETRGQRSNYEATTTTRGGRYSHRHQPHGHHRHSHSHHRHGHNHDDNTQPKASFQRLAGLAVTGIAVAITVAAAVVSYNNRGTTITPGGNSRTASGANKQPPVRLSEVAVSPHDESNSGVSSSSYPFRMSGIKDGKISTGGEMIIPGADGGGVNSEAAAGEEGEEEEDTPPNVIFILVDDLGMNDMGSTSTDVAVATPFIDSLANDGVRITRYYTNHICTPARASIMTGRDTFRTGMQYEELTNLMPWGLPLDEVTLAERFKYAGYNTHMVGKWNLGMFAEDYYPFNRGFDTFLGYLGPQESYYGHDKNFHVGKKSYTFSDFGYGDEDGYLNYTTNTTREGPRFKGVYSTTLSGDRAIDIAKEHMQANEDAGTDDPLFMYLAFQAAHSPMDVPEDWMFTERQLEILDSITAAEQIRLDFAKIVYYLDITIKRVFNALDGMGMMDNTLVVITSDNGGCPSGGGSNFPFRGFKHTLFEGGVRTPALVYSKDSSIIPQEARGTSFTGMMHAMDWTQTLANVTGIPTGEIGKPLSGYDQWSAIIGDTSETVRNEVVLGRNSYTYDTGTSSIVDAGQPRGAYIYDGWKINIGDKCTGWYSFSPTDLLLQVDPMCDTGECPTCTQSCTYVDAPQNSFLFHLDEDPYEEYNLINEMPDKFNDMVRRWNEACEDEVPSNYAPRDPDAFTAWEDFHNWVIAWQ